MNVKNFLLNCIFFLSIGLLGFGISQVATFIRNPDVYKLDIFLPVMGTALIIVFCFCITIAALLTNNTNTNAFAIINEELKHRKEVKKHEGKD